MSRFSFRHRKFGKTVLALAAGAALSPGAAWALSLAQAPPSTVKPYVRPNVIISVDDSGSMAWKLTGGNSNGTGSIIAPNPDGTWNPNAPRMNILKHALTQVFNDTALLPKEQIRLAWQVMWSNSNSADAKSVNSASMKENSMRPLTDTHRENFLTFVKKLTPGSNTPSHRMFSQADAYMRRTLGINSPWASDPGNQENPILGCRRNYHIMMTDGRWNSAQSDVTNQAYRDDATNRQLPDGTIYGGSNLSDTQLYRDTEPKTLADWAFHSWANPLQDPNDLEGSLEFDGEFLNGLALSSNPNKEQIIAAALTHEDGFGLDSKGNPAKLKRYWNPQYNPATWPHMVTYTIGFSNDAITWPGAGTSNAGGTITPPTEAVPFGYDGSFPDLVNGERYWPKMSTENVRALDLWHAAINGRGRFYAVNKGEDLEKAFREIIGKISSETTAGVGSSARSGSNISRSQALRFISSYDPQQSWKGAIRSEVAKTADGNVTHNPDWGNATATTATKLDALASVNNRLILSWRNDPTGVNSGGVSFEWNNLDPTQQNWLQRDGTLAANLQTTAWGQAQLQYIRGERSKEGTDFRKRESRQGDILNSYVWYTGAPSGTIPLSGYSAFVRDNKNRTPMIYVGGNDGMLHGFSAENGEEKIAYVPKGVIPTLRYLGHTDFDNKHHTFVDGSPMTGDVNISGATADWRTLLVGTLGAGGKGYFVLDVTNPGGASDGPSFAATNAAQLVILDQSYSTLDSIVADPTGIDEKADIGHILASPVRDTTDEMRASQITRMNNDRWAVVLGNGYNSANARPVLLVQYLDGAKELVRIPVTGNSYANDNGLAAPRLIDIDGDGRTDVVYAGDNMGNMWKFDLTSPNDSNWNVAFNTQPLFTAEGPAGETQPISTPPTVRANDRLKEDVTDPTKLEAVGGMMVAFGTGRNIAVGDPQSTDTHTLYSVLDNSRYCRATTAGAKHLHLLNSPGDVSACDDGANIDASAVSVPAVVASRNDLAEQKITDVSDDTAGVIDPVTNLDPSTWVSKKGWYLDLPVEGERILEPINFFDGSNILNVISQVPEKGNDLDPNIEACDTTEIKSGRQFRTLINIMDGKRPSVQLVDYSGDQKYDESDQDVSRVEISTGPHDMFVHGDLIRDIDADGDVEVLARMPEEAMRPTWRQLK